MGAFQYIEADAAQNASFQQRRSALRRDSRTFYTVYFKRVFDIVLALILLPVVVPAIAVLWAITVLDGGRGFFGHQRIGRHGHAFRCWKIRTMVVDAEKRLNSYLQTNTAAAEEWRRDHKLSHDPRVTRFGAFLRATSLDELPQIWNVLTGEMSFVGPRPVIRSELRRYGAMRTAYLSMRPGITGMWQVSGRNSVSYDVRVQLDASYVRQVSLSTDVKLILRTATTVVNRTGR